MNRVCGRVMAALALTAAPWVSWRASALAQPPPEATIDSGRKSSDSDPDRVEPGLPPALPDDSRSSLEPGPGETEPAPIAAKHGAPLRLGDAVRRSLANVQTVQANVAVRAATVARFDTLKNFVPLMNLPQFMAGFSRFTPGSAGTVIDFPSVMGFTQFSGQPGLDHLSASRLNLLLPIDPSGQIVSLPIAEEGIHAKLLMEQLVRRSQATLAIQSYFEAKQILYGIRVARLAQTLARETRAMTGRKLLKKQANGAELSKARIAESESLVALANLENNSRIAQRELAVVLHQSRLLVPQDHGPLPIELDPEYSFDLNDADPVDLAIVPDFPSSREEAIQLAKRQRVEVRILVAGLRIAHLRNQGARLRLFGTGGVPAELSFKNTTAINHGVALGAIFGGTYSPPLVDVDIWARIRQARLDVVQSQLDLEKSLVETAKDVGNSWDRWQQASREFEQKEKVLGLQRELFERQKRLFERKQSFRVEVLGTEVDLLQADANRWTAWYNLQLARLDMLRATELLLDYTEKAGMTQLPTDHEDPPPGFWKRRLAWLTGNERGPLPPDKAETSHEQSESSTPLVAATGRAGAQPLAEARPNEVAPPRQLQSQPPTARSAEAEGPPPTAALRPGMTVTVRIRQVFPCDGLGPAERLLNGRQPIQASDRFLAEVIRPAATAPPLVGGTIVKVTPPAAFGRPGSLTLEMTQIVTRNDGAPTQFPWLFETEDPRISTRVQRKLLTGLMGLEGVSVGASLGAQLLGQGAANPVFVAGGAGIGMIFGVGYASLRRGVEANLEQGDTFEVVVGTASYRPVPRTLLTTVFPAPDPSRPKGKRHP